MSKVISFRLNPNNAREASVITVIRAWQSKGYSLRHIMSEALLKLDVNEMGIPDERLSDLYRKLDEISVQIQKIGDSSHATGLNRESSSSGLSHHFVDTIKVALKPGIQFVE